MPIVHAQIVSGRSGAQKRRLIEEVSAAVVRALDVPLDTVRVLVSEVEPECWGVGGVPKGPVRD
ncbi:2-hydroxymuconate tautomerase family protein [Conexibacter stalactiti]|uniref:Tautomerase n=1 Tax=Conexibacter stalactiti TaxID=1940611 RepID=A0ABU4HL51_9ACTN|nr:2-hydroxymuconate tautomerase family protein [Conexibacter stalactiti]MDW5594051.1 2-hydroxymuconate tautomerase family protein [Conexibacter stalactiti]MEC5034693.1 2-hydroxymuconate tautomerase family protein [Conexibacter stalactiti]